MCSWYAVAAPGDDDDVDGDDVDGGDVADGVPAGDDGAVEVHAPSARVMAAPTPRRFTRWFGPLGKGAGWVVRTPFGLLWLANAPPLGAGATAQPPRSERFEREHSGPHLPAPGAPAPGAAGLGRTWTRSMS